MSDWQDVLGVHVVSFGRWTIHVSALPTGQYWWAVSSDWGTYGTGLSDTEEQAKMDALDHFIGVLDGWRLDAERVRSELGGAAAKE